MTVILRAFLVVGVLTYFAVRQREGEPAIVAPERARQAATTSLSAAWDGLTSGARERIAREGVAEVARQFAIAKPSQDTLASSDRKPAWRGALN